MVEEEQGSETKQRTNFHGASKDACQGDQPQAQSTKTGTLIQSKIKESGKDAHRPSLL